MTRPAPLRVAGAALVVAGALTAGGCSEEATSSLAGTTWEVVAVYTDPQVPGAVPADAAGRAVVVFGAESISARTGCAPLQAGAVTTEDTIRIEGVQVGPVEDDCVGGSRRLHDELTAVLEPHSEFSITHYGGKTGEEITLTRTSADAVVLEPDTLRLIAR